MRQKLKLQRPYEVASRHVYHAVLLNVKEADEVKFTYDPNHNVAYLRLHERSVQVETIHVSDELNVDLAPDGTIYGIELLNANDQLRQEDAGKLIVFNESTGKTVAEVKLA